MRGIFHISISKNVEKCFWVPLFLRVYFQEKWQLFFGRFIDSRVYGRFGTFGPLFEKFGRICSYCLALYIFANIEHDLPGVVILP